MGRILAPLDRVHKSGIADEEALAWHAAAPVADAHADSLLWNRDLASASSHGHVDFPRLADGGVKVQAFTIPTRGWPVVDGMGLFAAWRGWPRSARRSPLARALWQADALARAVERSSGRATLVRTRTDLDAALAAKRLAAVLGVEGAHALEGDVANLARLLAAGVRFLGPSHLVPNPFASCSVWLYRDRGLTGLGRELVSEMARLAMPVDLAHASPRAFDAIVDHPSRPALFCSHTGVRGARDHWRNVTDDQLRAISARGGVVGIILARPYLGGAGLDAFVRHVRHAVSVVGPHHVAVGSDFDGFVRPPREIRDARDFPRITAALRAAGLGREATTSIVGASLVAFLRQTLPA
ncbi:MAG TPA: membrane dipeptidase [Planctomycetota bacterium]|nr:membrane dipeptidase [Planctomycetota bacterium]